MQRTLREKINALLSEERGAVVKAAAEVGVALAYPNTYHVGMSNLGMQRIYSVLNNRPDTACERVFLPEEDDLAEYQSGVPLLSMEGRKPVMDFDILAFSVSFEQDYVNIVEMLKLSRIPLYRAHRSSRHPLLILGGVCAFSNPEPLADFFDVIIVGEGEEVADEFIDSYKANRDKGRAELLRCLAAIEGVYVPEFYDVTYNDDGTIKERLVLDPDAPASIKKRVFAKIDQAPAASAIITPNTEFGSMYLLEVSRGCGRHCRFCMAGYIYLPPRSLGADKAAALANEHVGLCGKVGLVGAALSDYPGIERLSQAVKGSVSVSSLRADSLSEALIQRLAESGHKTISLAPEAGSERLRKVINKGITEEDILSAADMVFGSGIPNLKLYFIIGLPTEEWGDIEEIVRLAEKVHDIQLKHARPAGRIGRITLSVNSFIPKPFTPFQWEPMEAIESLNKKLRHLEKAIRKIGNVNMIHDLPKWGYVQALLSRGDRRLGRLIEKVHKKAGDWRAAAREVGLDTDFYVKRRRGMDEILPWDFIDMGVRKEYLMNEYYRALEGKYTPPCRVGACRTCGVCNGA